MVDANKNGMLRILLLLAMIIAVANLRLLAYVLPSDWPIVSYLYNFAPITALALFGGAKFSRPGLAICAPLAAFLASDVILHVLGHAPLDSFAAVVQQITSYAFFVGVVGVGRLMRGKESLPRLAGASVACTIAFWVVSNFVYWLLVSDTVPLVQFQYPKTLEGLWTCYVNALPFLRNPLLGDLFYVAVLFGGHALLTRFIPSLREEPAPAMA